MNIQNKAELKTLFHQDGKKVLEGIARLFAFMDQKKWNPGLVNEVFQSIHSLKSEASFFGYTKVATDAERMEEQLTKFRKALPTEKEWKEFRQQYLALEADLGTILRGVELELSPSFVTQVKNLSDFEKVLLKEAIVRGETLYRIDAEVEDGEAMPYPRLYLLINTLELRTNVLRITPPLETLQKDKLKSCSLLITSSLPRDQLQSWTKINGLKKVIIQSLDIEDFLGDEELSSERKSPIFHYRKVPGRIISLASIFFQKQELIISCMGDANSPLVQALMEGIMEQTGTPLELLVRKASQLVSDLAPQLGKDVTFHGEDQDTIDTRKIKIPSRAIEGLNVAMNHLIRNAVDHGIEPPEERRKMGKPSFGTIRLSFSQKGSRFTVRVQDDGRGIDREVILSKAHDAGMKEGETSKDKDLLSLLVQGGVSTKVSSVSGRGIGLQTVRSIVENLGGTLTLQTTPGKGTLFEMSFDLLSLKHPVFPCKGGERLFYVPKILVEDFFPLSAKSISVEGEKKVYPMRGKELPLQTLSTSMEEEGGVGILLSLWERQGVLWAEAVGEEQWISPQSLKKDLEEIIRFLLS